MRKLVLALAAVSAGVLGFSIHAAPVPGTATDSPLAVVPAQAPVVIQIRGVDKVKDRLNAMLKEAIPDFAPVATALIDSKMTDLMEGRSMAGADKNGPVFVALMELPGGDAEVPPMAIIAKVSKYAEFRDGMLTGDEKKTLKNDPAGFDKAQVMGRDAYFLDRGGYAVMTPSKDVATLLSKQQAGLDTKLTGDLAKRFMDNDMTVFVNMASVNKMYGDTIKGGREQLNDLIDQMGGQLEKGQVDAAKMLYNAIFQLLEDGKTMVMGFDFKPNGLSMTWHSTVGAETKSNGLFKDSRPSKMEELTKMAAGYATYSATNMGPAMIKAMGNMAANVMPDAAGKKLLEEAMKLTESAGSGPTFSATNFPAQGLTVQEYKDPNAAVAAQIKMMESLNDGGQFQNAPVKGKPEIKKDYETYKGIKLNYASVNWDLDKLVAKIPNAGDDAKAAMKKVLGEGQKTWFGTDGKMFYSVTAKDEAAAKSLIDNFMAGGKTLGSEGAYEFTRKNLPEQVTMLNLMDANKFTQSMGDYMLSMMQSAPLPVQLPKGIKPVAGKTAFMGFAMTVQPEQAGIDFFLPTDAIKEIRKVIESAISNAGQ